MASVVEGPYGQKIIVDNPLDAMYMRAQMSGDTELMKILEERAAREAEAT